jgi:hypothetical protein
MKFQVIINPFKHEAIIKTKMGNTKYSKTMYYFNNDEWNSFDIIGQLFDIHFCYDKKFTVSVYTVKDSQTNYEVNHDIKLTIKLTD